LVSVPDVPTQLRGVASVWAVNVGVCQPCAVAPEFIPQTWFAVPLVLRFVAVDELPVNAAVIVPALKLSLPSRSTIVDAVFAVA
jgi:hypothetical protein